MDKGEALEILFQVITDDYIKISQKKMMSYHQKSMGFTHENRKNCPFVLNDP